MSGLGVRAREAAAYRDIPRSCVCAWSWQAGGTRWVLVKISDGCPWHTRDAA